VTDTSCITVYSLPVLGRRNPSLPVNN